MSTDERPAPRTLLDYLRLTTDFLAGKKIDGARLDAELLLAEVLGMARVQLYTNFERPLAREEIDRYRELVRRRAAREPVAYILGRREFWSLEFEIDRRVLVPRPDTELLVELAVAALTARAGGELPARAGGELPARAGGEAEAPAATAIVRVADIGTGSGALAVAIAKEVPSARVVATDKSQAALELAPRNAERHGVAERIEFVSGDLCEPLRGREPFDLIVSNPPYIKSGEMAALDPEVRDWEPRLALVSGDDGMDATAALVESAREVLMPGGSLWVEVGTQAAAVRECFESNGYTDVRVHRDLAGNIRVVSGYRPS
ncbi:MAG: peptide chain release factor N(5)-glutamine methyltransferase [Deltaproteobacteria bacterium]|nr:peptide chain release factor N(5)-glutamine methyltransferase [Deltaproteobacteria bacterium]